MNQDHLFHPKGILNPLFLIFPAPHPSFLFLFSSSKRMTPLPTGLLAWPWAVYKADWKQVLPQNGMDAYVFLRFLRMMLKIFIPIWFVSWAVLFPTSAVNSSVGSTGLNMVS
jgi:calcium permeable stress-gated cation channel